MMTKNRTVKKVKTSAVVKSPLVFKVGKVWAGAQGNNIKIPLNVLVEFPDSGIKVTAPLQGELMMIKLKEEISVIIKDASIGVRLKCGRCLNDYDALIRIPGAEREFLSRRPSIIDDLNDVYLIDMKDLTIDIYEMVRQEIILHFPFIQVCSRSCKGLCPICGRNRNLNPCACKQEDLSRNFPFKNLKKLINKKSKF